MNDRGAWKNDDSYSHRTSSQEPRDPGGELSRYEEIVERVSEGILVLDERLRPVLANTAAKEMLGLHEHSLPARLPSEDLSSIAARAQAGRAVEQLVSLWWPAPRILKVAAMNLGNGGGVLVTMQDVTEEQRAQRIRREFVAHASHELKSPVAGIQALAGAINQALADDPDAVARFSERLVGEADRLGRLINDLLDLSRLEDAPNAPEGPVEVTEIARRQAELVGPDAETKGMSLTSIIASSAWVRGDAQQLALLIRNLLDNAIRYTPEGGTVALQVGETNGEVVITVSDDGIGIPLEAQARVFERFYRVDRARSRERGGTGLGLAIVKHVAELHGGRVELQSELGRGSSFMASIPALENPPDGTDA